MKILLLVLTLFALSYSRDKKDDSKKADTSYTFSQVEIVGYQDNPTPFYILDANDGQNMIVDLERSFSDALKRNVDKETIQRTHE